MSSTIPAEDYGEVSAPRFQTRSAVWCVEEVAFADVRAAMAQDRLEEVFRKGAETKDLGL
jgi:hypothetical protein